MIGRSLGSGIAVYLASQRPVHRLVLVTPHDSVLALAEQYLEFVEQARILRIELAADYLVMAAWLAFLKSRLLLPPDPSDPAPSGEDLAAHLAFQLERLQAMREAAGQGEEQVFLLYDDFAARLGTRTADMHRAFAVATDDPDEVVGINTVAELAAAEALLGRAAA